MIFSSVLISSDKRTQETPVTGGLDKTPYPAIFSSDLKFRHKKSVDNVLEYPEVRVRMWVF